MLTYAPICINLKDTALSEMSVTKEQIPYDSIYVRFVEQSNSQRKKNGGCQAFEGGNGELLFNEYGVSIGEDEKVLEIDGDDCTIM